MRNQDPRSAPPILKTESLSRELRQWTGEERLLVRILIDAVRGYLQDNEEDIAWIENQEELCEPGEGDYFTFQVLCTYLRIDPEDVRFGLQCGEIDGTSLRRIVLLLAGRGQ